jgi:hypothetical protein
MTYKQNIYDFVTKWHVQQYQPYDCGLHSRNELSNDWKSLILNTFSKMKCCALSNFCKIKPSLSSFQKRKKYLQLSNIAFYGMYNIWEC